MNNEYFASANSRYGFKSFFGNVFNPDALERIYIIKGGSGTGKSTMIRDIGGAAEEVGYTNEYFLCSSDTTSYDGLIIDDIKTAVIDGTAPHTTDPIYPGAVDVIVNTGEFWNESILKSNKSEIINIYKNKSSCYSKAYSYLKAAGDICSQMRKTAMENFKYDKMHSAVLRLAKTQLKKSSGYKRDIRLISSISCDGIGRLKSFEKQSDKVYIIKRAHGAGHLFLEEMLSMAKLYGQSVIISYDALDTECLNGIYFPELKISFLCALDFEEIKENEKTKYINMERFFDVNILKSNRQKLKFANKCAASLMAGAVSYLKGAREEHDRLEEIYASSMNFAAKEELTEEIIKKILSQKSK